MERIEQEHEALMALLQGKQEGLDYFFVRYYPALVYFARTLLNDQETARDIAEDAFVRLWQRRDILHRRGSIKSYLYTSVRNGCIDHLRHQKYRHRYAHDQLIQGLIPDPTILHHMIEAEAFGLINDAVQALPIQCGRVFRMFYVQGMALAEIATELNLSLSTIKSQKARAIQLLRKRLPPTTISFLLALLFSFL